MSAALAVVVLGHRAPAMLRDAVLSLLAQEPRPEIVVVNSGGGDAAGLLAGLPVPVIERAETLFPGAARNLGIAATRAPLVGFLAEDCLAAPGWAAARIAAHAAGAEVVASSLLPDRTRHPVALAAHLSLFAARLPTTPAEAAQRYGCSYTRALLNRAGPFREDLRTGEDTEFHARLGAPIAWHPEVRTIHRADPRLGALLADRAARGARAAEAWRGMGQALPRRHWLAAIAQRSGTAWRLSARAAGREFPWLALLAAFPLVVAANIAYAAGAMRATR
jgi:glycosyltransferase involved in cell wall biosynthesis